MSYLVSLENSTLTLNGTIITGFSDDSDALTFPEIDLFNEKYGADGKMTGAGTGTRGGIVTIKLLATSESVKFLSAISEQMKNGAQVVFSGTLVNHNTGASVKMSNGTIKTYAPFPSLGKGEVANMNYPIAFERVDGNFSSANFG